VNFKVPTHYAALGLDRNCSGDQIRTAYRMLAKLHHPDLNRSTPDAMARTQALNEAYEILSDPARRRAYDEEFARTERSPAKKRSGTASVHVAKDVHLGIEELLRGTTLIVSVNDPSNVDGPENYELVVPPETAPGARFRLKRSSASARGTVVVRVKVRPDFRFKVRGSDLRCDLKISTQRAAQGGTENVRGVTGNYLRVEIPARVSRGEIIRIAGEGLPRARGGRGDLLVRIMYRPEVRITRATHR
jgi:curved DNA-binding protein